MAKERTVEVPDIGDFDQVEVIEVLVSVGDEVSVEQSLITLESDKATMEIPAPFAGVVKEVTLAVGDQVSQGARIVLLEVADDAEAEEAPAEETPAEETPAEAVAPQLTVDMSNTMKEMQATAAALWLESSNRTRNASLTCA